MAERVGINFSKKMARAYGSEDKQRVAIKIPEEGKTFREFGELSVPADWVHDDQKDNSHAFVYLNEDKPQTITYSKKLENGEWEKTTKEMMPSEIKEAFAKNKEAFKESLANKEADAEKEDIEPEM